MFTVPKVNVIASDEGFSVHVLGRTGIEYTEGARSVFVDSEVLAGGHGIAISKGSIKAWQPPHQDEKITEEERQRIVDNICRAIRFRNQPVQVVDAKMVAEASQRSMEAIYSKKQVVTISAPKVAILDLGGPESKPFVASDGAFLRVVFGHVRIADLTELGCDVLFLYAKVAADGAIVGSPWGLRELIRDSGAKVVVFGLANSGKSYVLAGKLKPYGRANLVMTLDRCGEAFERFFAALFSKMKTGTPMPIAWVQLNPQAPSSEQPGRPEAIFACEIGPLVFAE